jgi:hypothetical protein
MPANPRENRFILLFLALLVSAWGIFGWFDFGKQTQAGFETDGNNTVIRVNPGSEAELAGLQPGDRITRVQNIPVEDASALSRLPRLPAGERRSFVIERGEITLEFFIAYTLLPEGELRLARVATFIGFCFLLFPITAYFRSPSKATQVLAMMGIGLGLAFMGGPYIAAYDIRSITMVVTNLFVFLGLASMLFFLMIFPELRPAAARPFVRKLVFIPALLLWAFLSWRLLLTPTATDMLNIVTHVAAGLVIGSYFLFGLAVLLRSYRSINPMRRQALSLNQMLLGTILAVLPVIAAQYASVVSPQTLLPYQDYYFVALVLIPMTWSLSSSKA